MEWGGGAHSRGPDPDPPSIPPPRQGEVCTMIQKKYSEFLPSLQSAEELAAQVDRLCGSIDLLRAQIENEVTRGAGSGRSRRCGPSPGAGGGTLARGRAPRLLSRPPPVLVASVWSV